jgi:hypothetical protein
MIDLLFRTKECNILIKKTVLVSKVFERRGLKVIINGVVGNISKI